MSIENTQPSAIFTLLMLDIKLLREDPDLIKKRLEGRSPDYAATIDQILDIDEQRRAAETEKQQLQAERKSKSKEIGAARQAGEDSSEVEAEVKKIGDTIAEIGELSDALDTQQRNLLLETPNLPHPDCPVGQDEQSNPEIRTWGEKPEITNPKDHLELSSALGILDFEAGVTIAGSGFVVFKGAGAKLERALIQFLLDLHSEEHGYEEVSPPYVVARHCMEGTGQLPKFEEDMYSTEEASLFLAPTAEVPVTNLLRDQILRETQLPIKYTAYTPCFRREAGASGKDNKGLIRMHQFDKVELVKAVDPATSFEELESLTAEAEKVLQLLGLHYRVIELCTGDLGFSATRTYDIEVWAPGQGQYLEVSSCSNFVDYQARRMNLRYKNQDGKNVHPHTLNGSGTALPRLYVALLETYQQPDGSILIPEALLKYFEKDKIS